MRWLAPPITNRSPGSNRNGRLAAALLFRPQPQRARRPERQDRDDGLDECRIEPIAVPRDAVAPVAVERGTNAVERAVVPGGERGGHRAEDRGHLGIVDGAPVPGGEAWFLDHAVVHAHGAVLPGRMGDDGFEE